MRKPGQESVGTSRSRRVAIHVRANFVAYLALFVALGGTSYAASGLAKNSVGTKQLKNKAVTAPKIAPAALAKLKGPPGIQGIQGIQGLQGGKGDQGNPGSGNTPSKSVSSNPTDISMAAADTVLLTTTITTTTQARISANGLGTFNDANTSSSADLSCVMNITPQPGSLSAMGQRYELRFITIAGQFIAPATAAGAVVEPAGTYKVDFSCNQSGGTIGDIKFEKGDLTVSALAP